MQVREFRKERNECGGVAAMPIERSIPFLWPSFIHCVPFLVLIAAILAVFIEGPQLPQYHNTAATVPQGVGRGGGGDTSSTGRDDTGIDAGRIATSSHGSGASADRVSGSEPSASQPTAAATSAASVATARTSKDNNPSNNLVDGVDGDTFDIAAHQMCKSRDDTKQAAAAAAAAAAAGHGQQGDGGQGTGTGAGTAGSWSAGTGASGAGAPGGGAAAASRRTYVLNRYVTDQHIPRPESYYEDVHTAAVAGE